MVANMAMRPCFNSTDRLSSANGWLVGWLGFVGFTLAYLIYGCCVDWLVGSLVWLVAWLIELSAYILGSKSLAQGDTGANK